MTEQNECKRCGTCCENGGPALHSQDLDLIEQGMLSQNDLITIRKGELIHHPATDAIQPVDTEFMKIAGKKEPGAADFMTPKKMVAPFTPTVLWDAGFSNAGIPKRS